MSNVFALCKENRKHLIFFFKLRDTKCFVELNSSAKCTAGNFFFSPNGYWNQIHHVQICQTTHMEWWADGISSVSATSPLSVFPSGPVQQQMSLANRWRLCMFKCDWRGQRHKVKLSKHSQYDKKLRGLDYTLCQCLD